MKNIVLITMVVIVIMISGCSKEVKWKDLEIVDGKTGILLGPNIWYCGSDESNHYFRLSSINSFDDNHNVWVAKANTPYLINEIQYSSNQKKWISLNRIPTSSGIGYLGGLQSLKK
jgi:hypothetical protein